ncbi:hypothetical protein ACFW04_011557 [Cataglyphis niger]
MLYQQVFYGHTCSRVHGEMMCISAQYFNLNRILLLTIGLWPYQQSKLDRLRFIFLVGILTTAILFQFTTFLTSKCIADFIVKILSNVLIFIIFVIHYIFFAINIKTVKDLLTQLQYVYDQIKDECENAIVEKYNSNAKRYTKALTTVSICAIFTIIIAQLWSNIIDVILTKNISQSYSLPIMTEYFVDQKKYYFLIFLHINAAICIGVAGILSIGTLFISYLEHICGLFKISSHRIKRAMRINVLQNINPKNNILVLEEIRCAVVIHRQAMKLIVQIALNGDNVDEILIPFVLVLISILYMFCANYLGQNLTDHNNYVFISVYDVQWYLAPLCVQKVILFLLQKNSQEFTISVGGLFIASLEGFATLVKASVSYFTVIYSTQ